MVPHFEAADVSSVKKTGSIFEGQEFCVMNGNPGDEGGQVVTKAQVEVMIASQGGRLVQNPSPNTYCVISAES